MKAITSGRSSGTTVRDAKTVKGANPTLSPKRATSAKRTAAAAKGPASSSASKMDRFGAVLRRIDSRIKSANQVNERAAKILG